jgi:hypothetical protein
MLNIGKVFYWKFGIGKASKFVAPAITKAGRIYLVVARLCAGREAALLAILILHAQLNFRLFNPIQQGLAVFLITT